MKTITIPTQSAEINALLEQASKEDLLLKTADGNEFVLSAVDDFDLEIARTRQNEELMALLEKRSRQTKTLSLEEVERRLGLQ